MTSLKIDATQDSLTGFKNRGLFYSHLEDYYHQGKSHETTFSLAIIDIDDFKKINDTYGHYIGDQTLIYFTECLTRLISNKHAEFYRIGGEEFAIIFTVGKDYSFENLKNFQSYLNEHPFTNNQIEIFITASIGLTTCHPPDFIHTQKTSDELFSNADMALYKAKRSGKNQIIST